MVPCSDIYKSLLNVFLVMDESFNTQAKKIFEVIDIQVVDSRRLLGGVVGDEDGRSKFVTDLVEKWLYKLQSLTMFANQHPQVAYAVLVDLLQYE